MKTDRSPYQARRKARSANLAYLPPDLFLRFFQGSPPVASFRYAWTQATFLRQVLGGRRASTALGLLLEIFQETTRDLFVHIHVYSIF